MPESIAERHPLVQEAKKLAAEVHLHQTRRDGSPYIAHPARVVQLLRLVTEDPAMLAAGWCHDVEETGPDATGAVPHSVVEDRLGAQAAEYVTELTDTTKPEDGPRAVRRALDRARQARISDASQTIKVADIYSNVESLDLMTDLKFAKLYLQEKALALGVLTRANPLLLGMAFALVVNKAADAGVQVFGLDHPLPR